MGMMKIHADAFPYSHIYNEDEAVHSNLIHLLSTVISNEKSLVILY